MPGVLVHDQVFPCDSHLLSPLFVENNAVGSHPFSHSEESLRVSSPLQSFPSDLGTDDCRSSSFKSSQNQLSLSALHGFECFGSSPSPPDRGSPKIAMFDAREELGRKLFSRSLSKLGGQGLLAVNEDIHLEELSGYERAMSEAGADVYSSLGLSPGDLKDLAGGMAIPIRGSYVNSCGTPFGSPSLLPDAIGALQKYLPSNNEDDESWLPHADSWSVGDVYSCDEFRMYEFKVRKCMRGRSHDWTECPFAHPGEKARRRDPRKFHYSGTACPDFRKGSCRRGDACEYAHGVFECWLHPARYRTQPCKDGRNCKRRVCFFAHTNEQLRFLPGAVQFVNSSPRAGLQSTLKPPMGGSYDGSPLRQALAGSLDSSLAFESLNCLGHNGFLDGGFDGHLGSPRSGHLNFIGKPAHGFSHISSPTSTLVGHSHSPPPLSPPLSPSVSPPMSPDSPSNYTALARSLSCLSASNATLQQPFSGSSLQASLSQAALSHVQASLAACPPSIGSLSTATTRGPSPVSVATPAHHHLDRLHSLPSISIPSVEGREAVHIGSPMGSSRETQGSQAMTDLIATLQQLELRARAAEASRVSAQWSTKGQSLHHGASSVPCTPTKPRWARQMDTWDVGGGETEAVMERVESGRDLRAKIYGRLGKENPLEHESPDIDWVNELLK